MLAKPATKRSNGGVFLLATGVGVLPTPPRHL